jgi:hypothetical protein
MASSLSAPSPASRTRLDRGSDVGILVYDKANCFFGETNFCGNGEISFFATQTEAEEQGAGGVPLNFIAWPGGEPIGLQCSALPRDEMST